MKNLLLILTLLFCITACSQKPEYDAEQPPKAKAVQASRKELPDETSGFGNLSYLTKIDITSSQDGVIKKLYFREGESVRTGAPAVLLDNPQIKLAVEKAGINYNQAQAALNLAKSRLQEGRFQAEAQLLSIEKAEAELVRAKINLEEEKRKHQNQEVLYEAGGLTEEAIRTGRFALQAGKDQIQILEKELEIRKVGCRDSDLAAAGYKVPAGSEAERRLAVISLMTSGLQAELSATETRVEASKKELASIRMAFDELSVNSPAAGVIGSRYFEEGERIKAGDKIYTVMDTSSLFAMFPVREKDALRLEKGMRALVFVDGTGETHKGTVELVYPQADSQSLSFLVRVLLDEGNGGLKPGMFVRVSVTMGLPKNIVTVPESAIVNKKGNEGIVFVLNGSVASERPVVMGSSLGEEREINSGIKAGELVVIQPGKEIKEGVYVSLVE